MAGAVLASSVERGSDRGRLPLAAPEGSGTAPSWRGSGGPAKRGPLQRGAGQEIRRPQRGSGWLLLRPGSGCGSGSFERLPAWSGAAPGLLGLEITATTFPMAGAALGVILERDPGRWPVALAAPKGSGTGDPPPQRGPDWPRGAGPLCFGHGSSSDLRARAGEGFLKKFVLCGGAVRSTWKGGRDVLPPGGMHSRPVSKSPKSEFFSQTREHGVLEGCPENFFSVGGGWRLCRRARAPASPHAPARMPAQARAKLPAAGKCPRWARSASCWIMAGPAPAMRA